MVKTLNVEIILAKPVDDIKSIVVERIAGRRKNLHGHLIWPEDDYYGMPDKSIFYQQVHDEEHVRELILRAGGTKGFRFGWGS